MPDLSKISQPGTCARSVSTNTFVPMLSLCLCSCPYPMQYRRKQKNSDLFFFFLVFHRVHDVFFGLLFARCANAVPELNDESVVASAAEAASFLFGNMVRVSFVTFVVLVELLVRGCRRHRMLAQAFAQSSIYFFFSLVAAAPVVRGMHSSSASSSGETFHRMKGPEYMLWPVPSIGHHQRPT
jgi:hypothetical protein